jgi:hypothetical protein
METPPNLQVHDLGHLGLVASVLDRIRLVETVDRLVGPRPGKKVSTSTPPGSPRCSWRWPGRPAGPFPFR